MHISEAYSKGIIKGWDEQIAREEFKFLAQSFYNINPKNYQTKDKFMLYEVTRKVLGKDTLNYGQAVGDPFAPHTKVLMADETEKNVEDVKIGDIVLNHRKEKAKVTNVIKKKFTGDLVTVRLKNWPRAITATESHHGMTYEEKPEFQYDRGERTKFGQMKVGDYILLPFGPDVIQLPDDKVVYTSNNIKYGIARPIESIERQEVKDYYVYCITTENEFTAIFNGTAQYQCVGFAAKNATEYLECAEIILGGQRERFRPIHPSFYYGTSRVQVGGGRIGGDGSSGSWMAEAVMKYGALALDEPGVPQYSGGLSRKWGNRPGPDKQHLDFAKKHLVKSAAIIRSWDEMCAAISSGYPIHICSNQGFQMEAGSNGLHEASGSWAHALCAPPDTWIKALQPKKICQIKVGDKVFSHNGRINTVTEVFQRPYKGNLIKIRTYGTIPLKLTPNHPVLVYRDSEDSYDTQEDGNVLVAVKKKVKKWVNAQDVRKDDYLISPAMVLDEETTKLPKWINNSPKCKRIPNDLFIDDDIAWLIGLYTADGSARKGHKVIITLGEHETALVERCVRTFLKLGLNTSVIKVPGKKAVRCIAYSSILGNSFAEWFGKKTEKRLPEWVFTSGLNLREVLNGIFDGDGGYTNNKNQKRICNTSWILIEQCHSILMLLGERPNLAAKPISLENLENKNINVLYTIDWVENPDKKVQYNYWKDNDLCLKIRDITEEYYEGDVYNFEVDKTHSYIANGMTVHNCIIGFDNKHPEPYGIILNSWADVHGRLKDFETGEPLPIGVIRARRRTIEGMIRAQEAFAYSQFDEGFPDNSEILDRNLFDFVSDWRW